MSNTKEIGTSYIDEHMSIVPTFITACKCGQENKWITTGVMILTIDCKNCGEIIRIEWPSKEKL